MFASLENGLLLREDLTEGRMFASLEDGSLLIEDLK